MKAIILAAGRGSRLGKLTDLKPKGMTEIFGIPLLDWQHSTLKLAGIKDIFVVTGYLSEVFEKKGYQTLYNPNWHRSNMVASLMLALENCEPPLIVSYSDIIFSKKIINDLIKSKADLSVAYDKNWLKLWQMRFEDPLIDAESFALNSNKNIIEIGNKVKDLSKIQGQFMGLLKINLKGKNFIKEIINQDKSNLFKLDTTTLLNKIIKSGKTVHAIANEEGWCEVDSPNDINVAAKLIKDGIIKLP